MSRQPRTFTPSDEMRLLAGLAVLALLAAAVAFVGFPVISFRKRKVPDGAAILLLACVLGAAGAAESMSPAQAPASRSDDGSGRVTVIQDYEGGLSGVCATNPSVHLSIGQVPAMPDERVLIVEYPVPTGEPASRDVRCAAKNQDWRRGRAISFQIKPEHAARLSVSFFDRNRVAYTAWRDLSGGEWQPVRIPFDEIRPNPFFQRPDAKRDAPLDVSEVAAIAFAPQDKTSGRLTIGRFVLSN